MKVHVLTWTMFILAPEAHFYEFATVELIKVAKVTCVMHEANSAALTLSGAPGDYIDHLTMYHS